MKMIDAHVHLMPKGMPGRKNEALGMTFLPNGEICDLQGNIMSIMPEMISDSSFTAETMLKIMEHNGIQKAVIMANSLAILEETARAVNAYPGRFAGAMVIPQGPDMLSTLEKYYNRGLRMIKFEMSPGLGYTHPGMYPNFRLNCPEMDEVYSYAGKHRIAITVDPHRIGSAAYQTSELEEVTARFPETHFIICHLGFPDFPMAENSEHYRMWRRMTDLAKRDNVWFDIAAITDLYREERYPFKTGTTMVRRFMDDYGAEKIIWGSDAPGSLMNCTYKQIVETFSMSPLFNENEKKFMFAKNAEKAYNI